jgi:hypothetical protein
MLLINSLGFASPVGANSVLRVACHPGITPAFTGPSIAAPPVAPVMDVAFGGELCASVCTTKTLVHASAAKTTIGLAFLFIAVLLEGCVV